MDAGIKGYGDSRIMWPQETFWLIALFQINDTTLDGRKVTSIYSLTQPNVLTEFIIGRRVNSTVVRKFYPKGINIELEAKGVIASSLFSRKMLTE